jgi:hypothetical protein
MNAAIGSLISTTAKNTSQIQECIVIDATAHAAEGILSHARSTMTPGAAKR